MKIFISHSKKDRPVAIKVRDWLNSNNQEAWFDEDELLGGDSLISKIAEGLSRAECLILINSINSNKSSWVKHELEQFCTEAIQSKKKILILQLENCEIPAYLKHLKYIDFSNYERGFYELSETLKIQNVKLYEETKTSPTSKNVVNSLIDNSITTRNLFNELREGVEIGLVDQKFLYWNVDSSKLWVDLCHNSEYPLYTNSIQLLLTKFRNEIFPKISYDSGMFGSFVNMGVGSGQKDYIILKELINKAKTKYFAIDLSYSMIQETLTHVLPLKKRFPDRLEIMSILGDIEKLGKYKKYYKTPMPTLYGFLGSNISNFKENHILSIFRSVMEHDDILLLEVDWIGERNIDDILDGYSDVENMRFIWQPLAFLGIEKRDNWDENFTFSCSEIDSDIPDSLTVISQYNIDGRNICLSKSSKYKKISFLNHLENHLNFEIVDEFSINSSFGMLAIKKPTKRLTRTR